MALFSTVVEHTTSLLQQRFTRIYAAPIAVGLASGGLVGWLATGNSVATLGDRWSKLSLAEQLLVLLAFLLITLVLALLAAANSSSIVRLFEGYGGPAKWLAPLGKAFHKCRWEEAQASASALYYYYPADANRVMPTKLGNILRAAEDYPSKRYGIQAPVVWPRLYGLLPQTLTQDVLAARETLDAALMLVVVSGLFSCSAAILLPAARNATLTLYLVAIVPSLLITALAYTSANRAAIVYGETIRTAFDLHRQDLLECLGLGLPRLNSQERLLWESISNGWFRGTPFPRE